MALHTSVVVDENITPTYTVVLAHGFTQNGRCWGGLDKLLAQRYRVVCVDLPGHGRSDHDEASLELSAELLAEAGGQGTYVGYSMGGRIALHLAIQQPSLVHRLVLLGTNPGIEDAVQRQQRAHQDNALAEELLEIGVDAFIERWLQNPLFDGLSADAAAVEERVKNRPTGLASTLRHRSVGQQRSLWPSLGQVSTPTALIAGSEDPKYCDINRRAVSQFQAGHNLECPGSHAVHLQEPEVIAHKIIEHIEHA